MTPSMMPLLAGVEADQLGADLVEDGVDRLLDALAEVALLVAVAALDRLEGAGGGAGGHRRAGDGAVVEGHLDLDRRVAARVEDLAGAYCLDGGHRHLHRVNSAEGVRPEATRWRPRRRRPTRRPDGCRDPSAPPHPPVSGERW